MTCLAVFFLIVGLIMFMATCALVSMTGFTAEATLFGLMAMGELILGAVLWSKGQKNKATQERNAMAQKMEIFYRRCVEAGVVDMSSHSQQKKAVDIAMGLGLTNVGRIDVFYERCRQESTDAATHAKDEALRSGGDRQRQMESEQYRQQTRFSRLRGREKTITMLQTRRDQLLEEAETCGSSLSQELEEQIRQLEQQMEQYNNKMMAEPPAHELMCWLKITNEEARISSTGAITVTARISTRKGLKIYEQVPAVVDGTVLARISQQGRFVGLAELVLPIGGATQDVEVSGICPTGGDPDWPCQLEFTAENLWSMEA